MIYVGDGYRTGRDLAATVVVVWEDAEPTVYDGTLPAGEIFEIAEEPEEGDAEVDILPARYPQLEERFVPSGDRGTRGYRGYFLRIAVGDVEGHCEEVSYEELSEHMTHHGPYKPTLVGRLVCAAIGLPLLLVAGFLLVICVMVTITSFYDPLYSSWDWVWAAPGAFVLCYVVGWCGRLVLMRPRTDGRLMSPRWFAGLGMLFSVIPFVALVLDLSDGALEQPGVLLAVASVLYTGYRWYGRVSRERRERLAREGTEQA